MTAHKIYPYTCEIDVSFPTAAGAKRTRDVLSVDKELGDRVVKTIVVLPTDPRTMRMWVNPCCDTCNSETAPFETHEHFRSLMATEAKMLRVAVSGFFNYLNVALKCQQEFDNIPGWRVVVDERREKTSHNNWWLQCSSAGQMHVCGARCNSL